MHGRRVPSRVQLTMLGVAARCSAAPGLGHNGSLAVAPVLSTAVQDSESAGEPYMAIGWGPCVSRKRSGAVSDGPKNGQKVLHPRK
ncbi:hypothetical protein NDU88_006579 [Pleurodeles waltl]|uniref:Secreted protein n=1 Tax=Pleurodeles waltl TaxID=8319 RepID=A0AAV7MZN0_PLEWA|nr:hypothetical protein NDU88_006579 [Pleurodeles waltl]